MEEIDDVINQVSGTQPLYEGDIIMPYQPERIWLWSQYSGTLLKLSMQTTILSMLACAAFCVYAREATGQPFFVPPDSSIPFVNRLALVHDVWDIQKGLTTFVLTFFVNQSFSFWKDVYKLSRDVQQHLNNFNLMVSTNVERKSDDGGFTDESKRYLEDVGQFSRLYHILLWASKAKRFSPLATSEGLVRMQSRGLMTDKQLEVIQRAQVEHDELYRAPLTWIALGLARSLAASTWRAWKRCEKFLGIEKRW